MPTVQHWSQEAEAGVIGCLLLDNECHAEVAPLVQPDDFWATPHRTIYRAISALIAGGKPVDVITLADAMRAADTLDDVGGIEYINACAGSVGSVRMAGRYAEVIRERSQHRKLTDAAYEAQEIAAGDASVSEKLDRIMSLFAPVNGQIARRKPQRLADVMLRRTQRLEDIAEGKEEFVMRTGIPSIDDDLGGGIRPKKVIVLAARPSIGKSSLSQDLAERIAIDAGVPTLILSQEMSVEELADRAIARHGRIDYQNLTRGKLTDDEWSRVLEAHEAIEQAPIMVDDQPALRMEQIRAKAREVKGLKLLVIDYLQLAIGEGDNRTQQVGAISRGLKELAMEMDCAVILLSQLNREVDKRPLGRPIMSDLRDSGEIEQDADIIWFLWRAREARRGEVALIALDFAKNRGGPVGRCIGLNFDGAHQRWSESTEDPLAQAEPRRKGSAL